MCTVNPIFLTLNATEVSFLTSRLLDFVEREGDPGLMDAYKNLVSKVVSQLSEYTKERISQSYPGKSIVDHYGLEECGYMSYEAENTYEGLELDSIDDLDFYLKSRKPKTFVLSNGTRIKGTIGYDHGY